MENDKPQQLLQKEGNHHNQQTQHQQAEENQEEKQQQQNQEHQEGEEEKRQQHQERQGQQNHQEEEEVKQQEKLREEEEVEDKQNHTDLQYPLSKRTSPPRTIAKAQSSPDHSPFDSPLSSDNSSLSHGFSPPPVTSQPADTNSKPPAVASQSPDTNSKPKAVESRSPDSNYKPPAVAVSGVDVAARELSSRDQFSTPTATPVEVEEQRQKLGSGSGKSFRPDLSILRRTKRDKMVKKALLGFRISGFVLCLVSFSVLAADRDKGWALDSFYRYKEFRFCMAVNVIGFVYSGIQGYDLAYQLTSGKQKPWSRHRYYLDFVLDQVLAYLLLSASSSAAVRVDDWQSNWGKDKFPEMARASMALSLVAFIALALCSLISGHTLSTYRSM